MSGLEDRLIYDNLVTLVYEKLEADNWLTGRDSAKAVKIKEDLWENSEEVEPNAVGVALEDVRYRDAEIGSNLTEKFRTVVIDVLAENKKIGIHLTGDIADYLRSLYTFPIYDYTQGRDTDQVAFYCEITGVFVERNSAATGKHKGNWWVISFGLEQSMTPG